MNMKIVFPLCYGQMKHATKGIRIQQCLVFVVAQAVSVRKTSTVPYGHVAIPGLVQDIDMRIKRL